MAEGRTTRTGEEGSFDRSLWVLFGGDHEDESIERHPLTESAFKVRQPVDHHFFRPSIAEHGGLRNRSRKSKRQQLFRGLIEKTMVDGSLRRWSD